MLNPHNAIFDPENAELGILKATHCSLVSCHPYSNPTVATPIDPANLQEAKSLSRQAAKIAEEIHKRIRGRSNHQEPQSNTFSTMKDMSNDRTSVSP